ncbi:hypothetical protein [Mycolicibacterium sp. PDY-3]|uniref:hypothetical protein n=1 Tax=Mycolicibacterium sp. PDY-3 TaxID=3376069 RepID=UPI00378AD272
MSDAGDIEAVEQTDAEAYEKRVAGATAPLNQFFGILIDELDEQNGGFSWWNGHSDWKTLTLLSDYLIQSVHGVSESLLLASFAAKTHRESAFGDDFAMRTALRSGRMPFPLDAQGRRRHLTITQSAESCFFHLGQTLDRLAAAVIIVGGFEFKDVIGADWGHLVELADDVAKGSTKQRLQPVGSGGRTLQDALVAPVLDWGTYGPTGWLSWMRDTRNGMTHRAGAKKLAVMTDANRQVRLLYRQPRWSELQTLVFGSRPPKKPFFDAFIMSASEDILDGLCESLAALVAAQTTAMITCWAARAANPQLIVQHGRQWREVEPSDTMSNFPGYGAPVKITPAQLRLNPASARRWSAARIMDDKRQDWF